MAIEKGDELVDDSQYEFANPQVTFAATVVGLTLEGEAIYLALQPNTVGRLFSVVFASLGGLTLSAASRSYFEYKELSNQE